MGPGDRRRILSRVSADWSGIVVELLPRNLFHLHIRMSKHAHVEGLYRFYHHRHRRRPFPIRAAKSALRYYAARGSPRHPVYTSAAPSSSCILSRFVLDVPSFNAFSSIFFIKTAISTEVCDIVKEDIVYYKHRKCHNAYIC